MSKKKEVPPLVTDAAAFIRGAQETPATVVIGAKASEIAEAPAPQAPAQEPPANRPAAKPAAERRRAGERRQATAKPQEAPQARSKRPAKAKAPPAPEKPPAMPWDDANPSVIHYFQTRMPEPLDKKLQWIKDHSIGQVSKHDIVMAGIEQEADRRIAEIQARMGLKPGRAGGRK
jgi:hypothetical protein